MVESGGKCAVRGKSGEYGCFQFMASTWSYWSKVAIGYVAPQTEINERCVALYKIQQHLNEGYSDAAIARIWNQGNAGQCVRGTNKWGVKYDSCAYERKVMAYLR